MQRLSSCVAISGSCIGRAATPTNRSGRLATSAARTSFARRADLPALFGIGDALNGWRIERRNHDLDAGCVHQPQTLVLKVEEPVPQLAPYVGTERLRIAEGGFDREMILERDFSLHVLPRKHG